jgi:hypothetical protein
MKFLEMKRAGQNLLADIIHTWFPQLIAFDERKGNKECPKVLIPATFEINCSTPT